MARFTLDDVRTLGAKLDALELTSGEAAVVDALLGGGDGPEVVGFSARQGTAAGGRPGGYGDRMAQSFGLGFKVGIEGFTAPGDVAGIVKSGGSSEI